MHLMILESVAKIMSSASDRLVELFGPAQGAQAW